MNAHPAICAHERSFYRKRSDVAGRLYAVVQCVDCGHWGGKGPGGQARSIAELRNKGCTDIGALKDFDAEAFENAQALLGQARRETQRLQRQAEKHDRLSGDEYQRYVAYLRTDDWGAIRRKVLKRAGGVCEGCGDAPPTQVHHLTYDHLFAEFLWELQAVCEPCHDRIHREAHADHKAIRESLRDYQGRAGPLLQDVVGRLQNKQRDNEPIRRAIDGEDAA